MRHRMESEVDAVHNPLLYSSKSGDDLLEKKAAHHTLEKIFTIR